MRVFNKAIWPGQGFRRAYLKRQCWTNFWRMCGSHLGNKTEETEVWGEVGGVRNRRRPVWTEHTGCWYWRRGEVTPQDRQASYGGLTGHAEAFSLQPESKKQPFQRRQKMTKPHLSVKRISAAVGREVERPKWTWENICMDAPEIKARWEYGLKRQWAETESSDGFATHRGGTGHGDTVGKKWPEGPTSVFLELPSCDQCMGLFTMTRHTDGQPSGSLGFFYLIAEKWLSSSGWREIIPDGNSDPPKELKSIRNGKYLGRLKFILKSFFLSF